jgi:hypothetical protein
MSVPFEQQYEDVLQNIEFAIVGVYRENRELSDWGVETALDGLLRTYQAEVRGRSAPKLRLSELEQQVFDRVRAMCEWRMGREQLTTEDGQPFAKEMTPITLDEAIACLKRVRKSVDHWHKSGGRRGYLDFVSRFIL